MKNEKEYDELLEALITRKINLDSATVPENNRYVRTWLSPVLSNKLMDGTTVYIYGPNV